MRTKRYRVTLTPAERTDLERLISSGTAPARKLAHARILLKADAPPGEHGTLDADIADAVAVSVATVERVRRRFVEEGLDAALVPKPATAPHVTKLDGRGEARLLAEVCSPPPDGQGRWTLKLLAERLVDLEIVAAISYETVRRVLKKVSSSPGKRRAGACRQSGAPTSSARWRRYWTSMNGPTIPAFPRSASTKRASN